MRKTKHTNYVVYKYSFYCELCGICGLREVECSFNFANFRHFAFWLRNITAQHFIMLYFSATCKLFMMFTLSSLNISKKYFFNLKTLLNQKINTTTLIFYPYFLYNSIKTKEKHQEVKIMLCLRIYSVYHLSSADIWYCSIKTVPQVCIYLTQIGFMHHLRHLRHFLCCVAHVNKLSWYKLTSMNIVHKCCLLSTVCNY